MKIKVGDRRRFNRLREIDDYGTTAVVTAIGWMDWHDPKFVNGVQRRVYMDLTTANGARIQWREQRVKLLTRADAP